MLSWFVVGRSEKTDVKSSESTEVLNLLPGELLEEIIKFNHNFLFKIDKPHVYYFYYLLNEIKEFNHDNLNCTKIKNPNRVFSIFLTFSTFFSTFFFKKQNIRFSFVVSGLDLVIGLVIIYYYSDFFY